MQLMWNLDFLEKVWRRIVDSVPEGFSLWAKDSFDQIVRADQTCR
jgi:hypothetical protein